MRTIIYTNGEHPDFIFLCQQLDNDLNEICGKEKQANFYNQYNTLKDIHDVCIAYENNIPVGCAAFKQYENNVAEVKRVFVRPTYRGKGISKELMKALEEKALKNGFNALILETGKRLHAAISLYLKTGYTIIDNYEPYKDIPESVCMQKSLGQTLFDKFPELQTERLSLIEIKQSHLTDYYEIFKDENVTQYYNIIPLKKEEEAQKYLDWFKSRYEAGAGIRWGIRLKDEKGIIGTAGFNNFQKNHKANLGYDLHIDYWNQGYITEALREILKFGFTVLEINRVEAEVMQGNIASEKVLHKLGFRNEGILREWMYWDNKHYDMTMFSLLKKEHNP